MSNYKDNAFPIGRDKNDLTSGIEEISKGQAVFECIEDGSLKSTYSDGHTNTIVRLAGSAVLFDSNKGVVSVEILSGTFQRD